MTRAPDHHARTTDHDPSAGPRILTLPTTPATPLRDLLESIVAELAVGEEAGRGRVRLTLDVPVGQVVDADPNLFRGLVEGLVAAAFAAASQPAASTDGPSVREVVVTSVDATDAFELEIADSGAVVPSDGRVPSGARELARRCGGEIFVANCPEGGTAVTVRLSRRLIGRKAA
jgi:signal transduction histidine kinase